MDVSLNCSSLKCVAEEGAKQLQCCSCQRWVHYRCTQLPPYMLQAFIEKRIKKYYYCESCITVSKDLMKEVFPQSNEQNEVLRLRREVKRCENLIKVADENSRMVNKLLSEKIDRIDEKNIEKIIDSKLEKIEAILEKQVAEKKSYASVTNSQPSDFKSIMKMAKIEEISEERDRRSRASNIIVHGVKEDREEEEESTSRNDKMFVSNLLGALEEKEKQPMFIGRIGKKVADKNRPIKVALKNESEKKAIFKKLRLLKGKDEFKGVSVAEDYTESERKVFKLWSDKAKERSSNEAENVIWRVRGSPKNGTLRLKKFSMASNSQL